MCSAVCGSPHVHPLWPTLTCALIFCPCLQFDIETDVNLMDFSSFDRRSRSQSQSTGGMRSSGAPGSAPAPAPPTTAAQATAGAAETAQNPSLETALIEDFF